MIYIISSQYISETGKISYRYMFDAQGCDIDKIINFPYGYLWKTDDRFSLNLFEDGRGLVFGIGGETEDLIKLLKNETIPDCSILMTNDNAEAFMVILKECSIEFEWYKHSGTYLRTSD